MVLRINKFTGRVIGFIIVKNYRLVDKKDDSIHMDEIILKCWRLWELSYYFAPFFKGNLKMK